MQDDWEVEIDKRLKDRLRQLDELPKAKTRVELDQEVRMLNNFGRAALSIRKLRDYRPPRGRRDDVREDPKDEDGMRLRRDPETLERKHRILDAAVDALGVQLERARTARDPDTERAGSREHQLALAGQPRAA